MNPFSEILQILHEIKKLIESSAVPLNDLVSKVIPSDDVMNFDTIPVKKITFNCSLNDFVYIWEQLTIKGIVKLSDQELCDNFILNGKELKPDNLKSCRSKLRNDTDYEPSKEISALVSKYLLK